MSNSWIFKLVVALSLLSALGGCGSVEHPATPSVTPSPSDGWQRHELLEAGVSVELPPDWELSQHPGIYIAGENVVPFVPALTVGLRANVPLDLDPLTVAMAETWRALYATDFYTTDIELGGIRGVAFWQLPNVCVTVYAPSHGVIHELTWGMDLCESEGGQLNDVGERILDSVTFYTPGVEP